MDRPTGQQMRAREAQILGTFAKAGLSDLAGALRSAHDNADHAAVLRRTLERLGPTFVKLGQELSVRPDLLPEAYVVELSKLQDEVPPLPFPDVVNEIERELGQPAQEVFVSIAEVPIGSASIGQVHRARLLDGADVALKIMRPGADDAVELDLEVLARQASRLRFLPLASQFDTEGVISEFSAAVRSELDFAEEARNLARFHQFFAGDDTVAFPTPYLDMSTKRMVVMEFLDGIPFSQVDRLRQSDADIHLLLTRGTLNYFRQIFELRLFQSDPHLGNLLAMPGDKVGFVDFGRVSSMSVRDAANTADMLVALSQQDNRALADGLLAITGRAWDIDTDRLAGGLAGALGGYSGTAVAGRPKSLAFALLRVAHDFELRLPSTYTMLFQTLGVLEGDVIILEPTFDLVGVAQPYVEKLIRDRFRPDAIRRALVREGLQWVRLLGDLPSDLHDMIRQVLQGRIAIRVELPQAEPILSRLEAVVNRILVVVLLAAMALAFAIAAGRAGLPGFSAVLFRGGLWVMAGLAAWLVISALRLESRSRKRKP